MDRKSILILVVCFILLMLWYPLINKLYPPKRIPLTSTNGTPSAVSSTNVPIVGTNAAPMPVEAAEVTPKPIANTNVAEELSVLTNEIARYTFTSHGGGLKLVELLKYPETVSTHREKRTETNRLATLNAFAPAPALALLDGEAVEGDGIFKLTNTGKSVRAEKSLTNGLTIVKEFTLSTNYLLSVSVQLRNISTQTLNLPSQEWVVGTATPMGARDNGQAVGVLWYNGSGTEDVNAPWFANRTLGCIPGVPRSEYRSGTNVIWVAAHNQFFALVAMPQPAASRMVARKIDLPRPTGEEAELVATNGPPPQGFPTALVYPGFALAPGQALERQIHLFTGPKEYETLARIADGFGNNLDLVMGY